VGNMHVKVKDIDCLRFSLAPTSLLNANGNPINKDFSMFGFNGIANISDSGKPDWFVSKPHFLDADAAVVNQHVGLSPDAGLHDTFIDVEPFTGATLRGAKRLQLVVRLTPANVTYGAGINELWGAGLPSQPDGLYMPVYWADEGAEVSQKSADGLKSSVAGTQAAIFSIFVAMQVIGAAFAVLAFVLLLAAAAKAAGAPADQHVQLATSPSPALVAPSNVAPSSVEIHATPVMPLEPGHATASPPKF